MKEKTLAVYVVSQLLVSGRWLEQRDTGWKIVTPIDALEGLNTQTFPSSEAAAAAIVNRYYDRFKANPGLVTKIDQIVADFRQAG